jgi:hypothetical protein
MVRTETPSCSAASLLVISSRPDTVAGSNAVRQGVKDWHILTFPDTSCRPESGHRRLQIPRPSPQIAPRDDGWAGYVAVAATGRCWLRWSKPRASVRLWMTAGCCRRVVTDWMTPSRKDNYGIMVEMCLLPRRRRKDQRVLPNTLSGGPFQLVELRGFDP